MVAVVVSRPAIVVTGGDDVAAVIDSHCGDEDNSRSGEDEVVQILHRTVCRPQDSAGPASTSGSPDDVAQVVER